MIMPAGFYQRERAQMAALFPADVFTTLAPATLDTLWMTNPLPGTGIQLAFGDSPACGHYVIVSHPSHWYAEYGLVTQPNPLSAVALVTKLKHYIVAKEEDPQSVVRRHGLSVHEWHEADETHSDPLAA